MRFWDSSALVPLIIEEKHSNPCRQIFRTDSTQIVFCLSRTEILSALWRRCRENLLDDNDIRIAEARLENLANRWTEVHARTRVRDAAEKLLRIHPLRAADSPHLGHALPFSETSDAIENLSFSMMYLPRLRVTMGSKSLCRERGERSRHDCWLLASAVMGSSTEMKHHPFVVSADRLRGFDTLEWRTMLA